MKTSQLLENLGKHAQSIKSEEIETVDFDSLAGDLKSAAQALSDLGRKAELCDKFMDEARSEIKRMSLAVSRAKGDASALDLTERLLESEGLDYDDLALLRRQVRAEFDRTFPGKPIHQVMETGEGFRLRASEFKIGLK